MLAPETLASQFFCPLIDFLLQLLGDGPVMPLLLGRSATTATMRSRYMSRDSGPPTLQVQVFQCALHLRLGSYLTVEPEQDHDQGRQPEEQLQQQPPVVNDDGQAFML